MQYLREMYGHNECSIPAVAIQPLRLLYHSGRGARPQISVNNIKQVELLRTCGYTWEEVADALQVSTSTVWRRVQEMEISMKKYSEISDNELDDLVSSIQEQNPNCVPVMIQGHLKARSKKCSCPAVSVT